MLKQDPGGITDIEFLVQYLVLNFSSESPSLLTYSDNVRILEAAANLSLLPAQQAAKLTSAYTALRDEIHHRNLLNQDADVAESRFQDERECVVYSWNEWLID